MLELCKTVLNGVHEDKKLFKKELNKSLSWLNSEDQVKLQIWVKKNFYKEHADIIDKIFDNKYQFAS